MFVYKNILKPPHCSIIIPTYNQADFLRDALQSVLDQSYNNYEVVIVNNNSEDHTLHVVNEFKDNRISLVNFSNGGNIAASRNYGLSRARGSHIAFLDSDDLWFPEKLQVCLDKLQQGFDLVCHSEIWRYPGGEEREVNYGPESRASYRSLLLRGNCISTSAVLVRRRFIDLCQGFSETPDFITAEDYDLWLRIARCGARIGFIRVPHGVYRLHSNNNSSVPLRNMNAVLAVVDSHLSCVDFKVSTLQVRLRKLLIYFNGSLHLMKTGNLTASLRYLIKAILCLAKGG